MGAGGPSRRPFVTAVALASLVCAVAPATASAQNGPVMAGAAVVDGTYHVGNSAGQYSPTRDEGFGDVDPHGRFKTRRRLRRGETATIVIRDRWRDYSPPVNISRPGAAGGDRRGGGRRGPHFTG